MEVDAQLVADHPCLSLETYTIGMASGMLECSPNLYDFGQWYGQNSHGLGRRSPNVWLQGPQPGGCVAQDLEDRRLKTQTQLTFGDVGMAGPIYKPLEELFRI